MNIHNTGFLAETHQKFDVYKKLSEQSGPEQAWIQMLRYYPDEQIKRMMPFLDKSSLAEGFALGIPFLKSIGIGAVVVDISNNGIDAALEIHKQCPYMKISKKYGFAEPCHIICEMEMEIIRRAFPGTKAEIISRKTYDSSICVFKYERRIR
ncbi:MAG: L-2-amino-thiazoline-4-carboxylic acid hydrolase [Chlorobium sp.]|jgi:predicted ArsR family transcriptional regulator|nr:L-2-amino-thiazoline-4-carboxylic acid hydrolase [Chlorobium sp.]